MDQPKTTMLLTENRGRAMIWQWFPRYDT
jgi:hypothetical protein